MVHNVTRKKSLVYRYYTCIRAIKRGRASCKHPSLPAAEIESAVIQQIRCIAGDDGLRDEIVRQAAEAVCLQTAEFETQRHQLTRQLTREHEEVRRLATSNAYSTTTTARLAELHERIERGERQLRLANEQITEIETQSLTPRDVADAFDDFDRVWKALTTREQAELLGLLVAKVEFDQSDCTISISLHASGIASLETLQTEEVA